MIRTRKDEERHQARLLLDSHPSLVFFGPPSTGVVRGVEAVLGKEGVDPGELFAAVEGAYPDLQVHDGREVGVEDARRIRSDSTLCPSSWSRRYVFLSHVDRAHHTVAPTLLKLIEEPPPHFSLVLTTANRGGIPPTIFSRSLILPIAPAVPEEVGWWVEGKGLDGVGIRASSCVGDLDLAVRMEVGVVGEWRSVWESVARGETIPDSTPGRWSEAMGGMGEATLIGCWAALAALAAEVCHRHPWWGDLARVALETRNTIQDGQSNKIQLDTALIRVYALAVSLRPRGG